MTLDTDCVRLYLSLTEATIPLKELGLKWPPPERLFIADGGKIREAEEGDDPDCILVRTSVSELDDETAAHPNLARGASYHYLIPTSALKAEAESE